MTITEMPSLNGQDQGFFADIVGELLLAWEGLFGLYYDQGPVEVPSATGLLNGFLPILLVSFVVTLVIAKILDLTLGFRVDEDSEITGVDLTEHAETAYELGEAGGGGRFVGTSERAAERAEAQDAEGVKA